MKANEIVVGGFYVAKVGANITTVRVDAIRELCGFGGKNSAYQTASGKRIRKETVYDVTNIKTNHHTTFRSAMKFRSRVVNPNIVQPIQPKPLTPPVRPVITVKATDNIAESIVEHVLSINGLQLGKDGTTVEIMEDKKQQSPFVHAVAPRPNHVVTTGTPAATSADSPRFGLAAQIAKQTAVDTAAPHVQLKALAGTGKTTSVVQGMIEVKGGTPTIAPSEQQRAFWDQLALGKSDTVRISSFSSTITDELKARVNATGLDRKGVEARGVHSLGLQAVTKAFGRLEASQWAVTDIVCQTLGGDFRDLKTKPGMATLISAADDLVSLCKQTLTGPTLENLEKLASYYDVETDGKIGKLADLVPQVLERCKKPEGRIAFDDMVWLPLVLELPITKVDFQLIDEAQDLNRMQQELIYRGGHRIGFIGDPNQAIFGFAGADSRSMGRMAEVLGAHPRGCTTLPLTVTRRCGKAIVREAQDIVPDYQAHESNCEGLVGELRYPTQKRNGERVELAWEDSYCSKVRDGAMIVCRVNAPLVSQCFRFLKRKIKANILGRNIGQGLVSLIEKSKTSTTDRLRGWMEDWLVREQSAESKKKFSSEGRMIALQDRHDCIMCFADGETYTNAVVQKVKSVFTDNGKSPGIRLSSIHKAKGLEAEQVFFLQPTGAECPHPMAKSAWQQQQEQNLRYVAITRAIKELYHVY